MSDNLATKKPHFIVTNSGRPDDGRTGPPEMLAIVLIPALIGCAVGLLVLLFTSDPSALLILAGVVCGSLLSVAILFGQRYLRGAA